MELIEIFGLTNSASFFEKVLFYCIDKLVVVILVTVIAGLAVFLLQQQFEKKKSQLDKEKEKNRLVSTKIFGFAENALNAVYSTTNEHRTGKHIIEHIREQDQAILMLNIQKQLNEKAFEPFSDEINACTVAFEKMFAYMKSGDDLKALNKSLEVFANEVTKLANHCSEEMYS